MTSVWLKNQGIRRKLEGTHSFETNNTINLQSRGGSSPDRDRLKYFVLVTVTSSKPWSWANILPNINKCENGLSYLSVSFRVVELKMPELIQFAFPNHWFSSISYMPFSWKWRHHEQSFFLCFERAHTFLSPIYFGPSNFHNNGVSTVGKSTVCPPTANGVSTGGRPTAFNDYNSLKQNQKNTVWI